MTTPIHPEPVKTAVIWDPCNGTTAVWWSCRSAVGAKALAKHLRSHAAAKDLAGHCFVMHASAGALR